MFLIVIGVTILVVWFYVLFLREWLDAHFQGTSYSWWHKEIEDKLWAQSRTILAARLYWVGGAIIALHDLAAAAGIDVTPITTELANLIPEKYRVLVLSSAIILTGIGFEWLRRTTTTAVGEKK